MPSKRKPTSQCHRQRPLPFVSSPLSASPKNPPSPLRPASFPAEARSVAFDELTPDELIILPCSQLTASSSETTAARNKRRSPRFLLKEAAPSAGRRRRCRGAAAVREKSVSPGETGARARRRNAGTPAGIGANGRKRPVVELVQSSDHPSSPERRSLTKDFLTSPEIGAEKGGIVGEKNAIENLSPLLDVESYPKIPQRRNDSRRRAFNISNSPSVPFVDISKGAQEECFPVDEAFRTPEQRRRRRSGVEVLAPETPLAEMGLTHTEKAALARQRHRDRRKTES